MTPPHWILVLSDSKTPIPNPNPNPGRNSNPVWGSLSPISWLRGGSLNPATTVWGPSYCMAVLHANYVYEGPCIVYVVHHNYIIIV